MAEGQAHRSQATLIIVVDAPAARQISLCDVRHNTRVQGSRFAMVVRASSSKVLLAFVFYGGIKTVIANHKKRAAAAIGGHWRNRAGAENGASHATNGEYFLALSHQRRAEATG